MSPFFDFDELREGLFIKVNGKIQPDGSLLAVEIKTQRIAKYVDDRDKLQSQIQSVDLNQQTLTLLNQPVRLIDETLYRTIDNKPTDETILKEGRQVKIRGYFDRGVGFVPSKVTAMVTLPFNIDEMEGDIMRIDASARQFVVHGVRIQVNEHTLILQ